MHDDKERGKLPEEQQTQITVQPQALIVEAGKTAQLD